MLTEQEYLSRAKEADEKAEATENPSAQEKWLEVAKMYRELAAHARARADVQAIAHADATSHP